MSQEVNVCVLFGFGINCDRETVTVFEMVGGASERVHVNRLVQGERHLSEFDILAVPGGFSFGDHLGSGRLLGNRLRFALREQLQQFVKDGKPIIGICNGFQALVKTGLLPGPNNASLEPDLVQRASLTLNNTGRYEDRWVTLEFDCEPCIGRKTSNSQLPSWGRDLCSNIGRIDTPSNHRLVLLSFCSTRRRDSTNPSGPISPNGSMRNIAEFAMDRTCLWTHAPSRGILACGLSRHTSMNIGDDWKAKDCKFS